jgi:hypothetical protein
LEQEVRSLSRNELAYRAPVERRYRSVADESMLESYPTSSQIRYEIGVTLAAALSIAFVGNVLAVWLGG